MLKKMITFLVAVAVFAAADFSYCTAAYDGDISAQCAILYCANTGEILYRKNAEQSCAIASTTKILTALLACESGELAREVTVTDEMVRVEGTSMGLLPGDRVSVRTLVCGMLLQSGNDAANTVAIALDGSIESFAARMNRRAAEIGMKNSHFVNPSGLTAEGHYSTAYDMALLAETALQNDVFSAICSRERMVTQYGNPPYSRTMTNHNRLLSSYDGATGVKTGFTKAAGRCLVSSAVRDGVMLIVVTLNAPDDWNDHTALLDYGFSQCQAGMQRIHEEAVLPVTGGVQSAVSAHAAADVRIVARAEEFPVYTKIQADPFLYAPVKEGDIVGSVMVYQGEKLLETIPLLADHDCAVKTENVDNIEKKPSLWKRFKEFLRRERTENG